METIANKYYLDKELAWIKKQILGFLSEKVVLKFMTSVLDTSGVK